jgi:hypothetical protein
MHLYSQETRAIQLLPIKSKAKSQMLSLIAVLVIAINSCFSIIKWLTSNSTSTLSQITNAHLSTPYSRYWLIWLKRRGHEHRTRHKAHERLGPIIRLAPNEISVNCIENGVQIIYGGAFKKAAWYLNFLNYGYVENLVKLWMLMLSKHQSIFHVWNGAKQTSLGTKTNAHPRLLQIIHLKLARLGRNYPYYACRETSSKNAEMGTGWNSHQYTQGKQGCHYGYDDCILLWTRKWD